MTTTTGKAGLEDVVVGPSAITEVDGGAGRLAYRGYPIEALVREATFEQVAHLLWFGELPTATQAAGFAARLAEAGDLPRPVLETLRLLPPTCHPLDALRTAVSAAAAVGPGPRSLARG